MPRTSTAKANYATKEGRREKKPTLHYAINDSQDWNLPERMKHISLYSSGRTSSAYVTNTETFHDSAEWLNKPFRLMALPAEIRDRILEYSLKKDNTADNDDNEEPIKLTFGWFRRPAGPEILRVSRQIRAEAIAIYFKTNKFEIHARLADLPRVAAWIEVLQVRSVQPHHLACFTFYMQVGEAEWSRLPNMLLPLVQLIAAGKFRPAMHRIADEGFYRFGDEEDYDAFDSSLVTLEPASRNFRLQLAIETAVFFADERRREGSSAEETEAMFWEMQFDCCFDGMWWEEEVQDRLRISRRDEMVYYR